MAVSRYNRSGKLMLVLLALMILTSNTGVLYSSHYCHGRLTNISIYSQKWFADNQVCECIPNNTHQPGTQLQTGKYLLKSQNCCSNVSTYSKLGIEITQTTQYDTRIIKSPFTYIIPVLYSVAETIDYKSRILILSKPVQPVTGRQLVVFLMQLRIPSAEFIC